MKYEIHPVAEIMPPMDGDAYSELVEDVRQHGVLEAIWLYDGKVVDGRHRLRAATEVGADFATRTLTLKDDESLVAWVLSKNLHRRHLSASQRAMVATKSLPHLEEEARKRSNANLRQSTEWANLPTREGRARDIAAKSANVSGRSIETAKKIAAEAPELAKKVESGELSLHKAAQQIRRVPPRREAINDGTGEPAPTDLRGTFARVAEFDELARDIHALKRRVVEFASSEIGVEIGHQQVESLFKQAADRVRAGKPHAPCPCPESPCRHCQGRKWLTKHSHELVKNIT